MTSSNSIFSDFYSLAFWDNPKLMIWAFLIYFKHSKSMHDRNLANRIDNLWHGFFGFQNYPILSCNEMLFSKKNNWVMPCMYQKVSFVNFFFKDLNIFYRRALKYISISKNEFYLFGGQSFQWSTKLRQLGFPYLQFEFRFQQFCLDSKSADEIVVHYV